MPLKIQSTHSISSSFERSIPQSSLDALLIIAFIGRSWHHINSNVIIATKTTRRKLKNEMYVPIRRQKKLPITIMEPTVMHVLSATASASTISYIVHDICKRMYYSCSCSSIEWLSTETKIYLNISNHIRLPHEKRNGYFSIWKMQERKIRREIIAVNRDWI